MNKPLLELWGGHECTVNRVGDRWMDQTVLSGHEHRLGDLERFAEAGVTSLRYPVLWERVAPDRPEGRDFRWTDERLGELRRLGVRPIAGLIHHGSGPRYTHLLHPGFAEGLADHAAAVAERYPWLDAYTPVNEPLTTARFSALYGHWYPHASDEGAFWTALLNQIDATRLSMRAIRRVNPEARLIQTEDLGETHSTPTLAYQADYENLRRWATWDLLTGRVTPEHGLFEILARHGLDDRLRAIADDPCPPEVIGVNHYLTSERLLDHRLDRYPESTHGGNGRHRYADVEAVRALAGEPAGWGGLLRQAWERYRLPIAVTEAHNGSTRDEQMRWFLEAWRAAEAVRAEGADVVAVTAWALLGSHDWCSLLTRAEGRYECGVFDLRHGGPRPTAMVAMLQALARGEEPEHPALGSPGWWRRDIRLLHPPVGRGSCPAAPRTAPVGVCVLGSDALSDMVRAACLHRGLLLQEAYSPDAPAPWLTLWPHAAGLSAWTSRPEADPLELFLVEHTPSIIDAALDLALDGETGQWRVGAHGCQRIDAVVAPSACVHERAATKPRPPVGVRRAA